MAKRSKSELIWEVTDRLRAMQVAADLFDDAAAEALGVNRTDHRVLDVLERQGPMPAGRLAELNRLSPAAMTTVLDRLEEAGYARRVPDPDDRRRVLVEVTPLLRRRAMEIYGPFAEISQAEFGRYSVSELELISDLIARSNELSERQLETLRATLG
jgi:DNA-binding MarR family transcriptional regulator